MSEVQQVRRPLRRGRFWMGVGLLLFAGAGAGAAGAGWWFLGRSPVPPAPPEAKGDQLDPDVVTAVRAARERVLKEPRSPQAWGDLGEVFLANELEDESRPCFAEAERLDPRNPRWPYFQAGPLLNRGDLESALPLLRRAVELCPADDDAASAIRLRLAEALLILGQQDEVETQIEFALGRQPDDPRALFDRALLRASRENWEEARADLLRCLGSPFTQQKARVQLAAVCQRLGDEVQAEAYRAQADRLPPDVSWLDPFVEEYLHWAVLKRQRYRLADELEAAGRFRQAAAEVWPLTTEYPDDYLAQMTLGKLLAQMGDYAEAEPALRRALRLAPDMVQTHYYLALLLLQEGEARAAGAGADRGAADALFREAADQARQALAIKSDYGQAHMTLGLALGRLGQRAEAEAALRQAVRCNPEFPEPHFQLGKMLAEDGGGPEARSCLEQAVRLAPTGVPWRKEAQDLLTRLPPDPGAVGPPIHP